MLKTYDIKTGRLELNIENGDPDEFFRVEARNNPKRGFLFVSKVLGKHIPVLDSKIENIHKKLADKSALGIDTNKKTLVIGMAETATLLGFGVYNELVKHFSNKKLISFVHSTRYPSEGAIAFEESHSHAPSQFIHLNEKENYEQVILVDDELSTGNTFIGFEKILLDNIKSLKLIQWVCITDFRKKDVKISQKKKGEVISLLSGEWTFEWKNKPSQLPSNCENINSVEGKNIFNLGRYTEINYNTNIINPKIMIQIESLSLSGKVLIVGTGEFMPIPYAILKYIKRNINKVSEIYFQATTRSPAFMEGLSWDVDHYNEGVKQYLYNYNMEDYDHIILCVETKDNFIIQKMKKDMGAKIIFCV